MNTRRMLLTACIASMLMSCKTSEDKPLTFIDGNPGLLAHSLGGHTRKSVIESPVFFKTAYLRGRS